MALTHTYFSGSVEVRVEADAALARCQIRALGILDRVAVRVLHPKMEEAAEIRRALGAADHAVHGGRHGLALLREQVRGVVSSHGGDVARHPLEAPSGRRCACRWLAGSEPVEERGHPSVRSPVLCLVNALWEHG